MANLKAPELLLILLVLVLLFGAKKLPDISRSLGRSMRIFKSEIKQMKDDDDPAPDPVKEPRSIEGNVNRDERPTPEPRQVVPEPDRRDS
jgi:sec-independent protein translocase protein TatA